MTLQEDPPTPRGHCDAVWIDPARLSGEPCCGGTRVPVHMVVVAVWREDVTDAMRTWDLTRGQVLNACWYAVVVNVLKIRGGRFPARRGPWQRRWGQWALDVHSSLWLGDYNAAPDPPSEHGGAPVK